MKRAKAPEAQDHYGDNPADEGVDYEGPQADLSDPRQGFSDDTIAEYYKAMNNISGRAKANSSSRGAAASRMMED